MGGGRTGLLDVIHILSSNIRSGNENRVDIDILGFLVSGFLNDDSASSDHLNLILTEGFLAWRSDYEKFRAIDVLILHSWDPG